MINILRCDDFLAIDNHSRDGSGFRRDEVTRELCVHGFATQVNHCQATIGLGLNKTHFNKSPQPNFKIHVLKYTSQSVD
jgi:hypothetical protein